MMNQKFNSILGRHVDHGLVGREQARVHAGGDDRRGGDARADAERAVQRALAGSTRLKKVRQPNTRN